MRFAGFCCNGVTNNVTNILRDYFTDRPCHCPSASEVILRDIGMYPWTPPITDNMMTSPNRNIFRVTGHLCGEFTGHRWIPSTTQRPVTLSLMFSLICSRINGWVNNGEAGDLRRLYCVLWRQRNDNHNSVNHNKVIKRNKKNHRLNKTALNCNFLLVGTNDNEI